MRKSRNNDSTTAVATALESGLATCPKGRPLLVGVSGGCDSMVLLEGLVRTGFRRLVVCHLDHGLRNRASRADANLVRRAARRHGCAFESARAATKTFASAAGLSLEHAARELRLAFFGECARRHRCRRLVLAHHADDQVETCLHHFLRGSGAAGLAGMRAVTTTKSLRIFRPLLGVSRNELRSCAKTWNVSFREDHSNADPAHTRNRIRHHVLPAIESVCGPAFRAAILRAAGILREDDDWLESQVPAVGPRLSCAQLRKLPPPLRARTVLRWLRQSRISDPGFAETRRVLEMLDTSGGPAKINLPGGWHARRRSGEIFLEKESR